MHIKQNGLKNYGSTCYLNAFLQLYSRIAKLREVIYSLPTDVDETDIIYQLQVIFSHLELSICGVVDPGGLIGALGLSEEEQQDAPEFHCLFMHLLESKFRSAGLSVVGDLLRGEYVYETRCLRCGFCSKQPSDFLELSLKVSSTSLPECVKNYFKEDSLVGENQYACSNCQRKQNGVRRAQITRAPPLLCIQLLRFTYDPRSGQRKKQKATIRLPDTLVLTQSADLIPPDASSYSVSCLAVDNADITHRQVYQLRGVLLHIGAQPTSGHYIAVVRESKPILQDAADSSVQSCSVNKDRITDYWTVCNDTDICSIPAAQFNLSKVNGSTKALQASLLATVNEKSAPSDAPLPRGVSGTKRIQKNNIPSMDKRRKAVSTYDDVASTASLESVPHSEMAQSSASSDATSIGCGHAESSSSDESIPWHCSSNAYMVFYQIPDEQPTVKEPTVPNHLRELVEVANASQLQEEVDQKTDKTKKLHCLWDLLTLLWPPDLNEEPNGLDRISLVPTQWLSDWFSRPANGPPGESQFKAESKCLDPFAGLVKYTLPLCPHARIPVDLDVTSYRAVSTKGLIQAIAGPTITSPNESDYIWLKRCQPCWDCVRCKVALIRLEQSIRAMSKEMNSVVRSRFPRARDLDRNDPSTSDPSSQANVTPKSQFYWIGRRSLLRWRHLSRLYITELYAKGSPSIDSGLPDKSAFSQSPQTSFNADVLCRHGQLRSHGPNLRLLPVDLWTRVVALFPGARIPTFPLSEVDAQNRSCPECEALTENLAHRAIIERHFLPDLLSSVPRRWFFEDCNSTPLRLNAVPVTPSLTTTGTVLTATEDYIALNDQAIYLLPSKFLRHWRRFVKDPCPETLPSSLSSGLNGTGVLCEHDQLRMPWWELVSTSILEPVTSTEWNILSRAYASENESSDQPPESSDSSESESGDSVAEDEEENETNKPNPRPALPTFFLIPDHPQPRDWTLHPPSFTNVCSECYKQLQQARGRFTDARIRVRMVANRDEALVACSDVFDTGDNGVLESNPLDDRIGSAANVDKVGATRTRVLTIDAKLVFAPNVRLNRFSRSKSEHLPVSNGHQRTQVESSSTAWQPDPDNDPSAVELIRSPRGQATTKRSCSQSASISDEKQTQKPQQFIRRSARQRSHTKDLILPGSSEHTLQQFKVQLMQLIGVMPSDQHLMMKGIELEDSTNTLQQLNVHANSLLYLWTDDPLWDANQCIVKGLDPPRNGTIMDTQTNKSPAASKMSICRIPTVAPVEIGFKGTRLLDN